MLDQITKILITTNFELNEHVTIIPHLLDFRYVRNYGAAGGILANHRWVFMTITALVLIACVFLLINEKFLKNRLDYIAVVLIFSGGVGNMIDRTFRGSFLEGSVIDFFNLSFFPFIFNVADILVVVGAGLIIFTQIRGMFVKPKTEPKTEEK